MSFLVPAMRKWLHLKKGSAVGDCSKRGSALNSLRTAMKFLHLFCPMETELQSKVWEEKCQIWGCELCLPFRSPWLPTSQHFKGSSPRSQGISEHHVMSQGGCRSLKWFTHVNLLMCWAHLACPASLSAPTCCCAWVVNFGGAWRPGCLGTFLLPPVLVWGQFVHLPDTFSFKFWSLREDLADFPLFPYFPG